MSIRLVFIFVLLFSSSFFSSVGLAEDAKDFVERVQKGWQFLEKSGKPAANCLQTPSPLFIYETEDRSTVRLCVAGRLHLKEKELSWYDLQKAANEANFPLRVLPPEKSLGGTLRRSSSSCPQLPEPISLSLRKSLKLILPPVAEPSIIDQPELINDLWLHSAHNRGFSSEEKFKTAIRNGENLAAEIRKCALDECRNSKGIPPCTPCPKIPPTSKYEQEKNVIELMWYLQAEAGKKPVLNPNNWEIEPGFVGGGSYRFRDDNGLIFNYLTSLRGVYNRWSSHYPNESIDKRHSGLDMTQPEPPPGEPPLPGLPGHENTKTILFGRLTNGQIFLKNETQGLNDTVSSIKHLANYVIKKLGGKKQLAHFHSENMPKDISDLIIDYCRTTKKCNGAKLADEGIEKSLVTIQAIEAKKLKKAKDKDPLTERVTHPLITTILSYAEEICGKVMAQSPVSMKGCEAVLDPPTAPRFSIGN